MKTYAFLLLVFVFFTACKSKEFTTYELAHVEDIEFELPNIKKNVVYSLQIIENKSDTIIAVNYQDVNITLYNFSTREQILQIPLRKEYLVSFDYHSPDSVFVFYEPAHRPYYLHDSTFFRINSKGEELQSYSFDATPASTLKKGFTDSPDSVYYAYLNFQKLNVLNDKALFLFGKYTINNIGDSVFNSFKHTTSGHLNLSDNSFSSHAQKYPYLKTGIFYPDEFVNAFYTHNQNNNPVIGFAYTPDVFEIDLNQNKKIKHTLKTILADTVAPATEPVEGANTKQIQYKYIHYLSKNEKYLRLIELPENEFGNFKYTFVVSDKNFKKQGEGIFPYGLNTSSVYELGNKIVIPNYIETAAKNKLILSVFELKEVSASKSDFQNSIENLKNKTKKIPYPDFLQKYNTQKADTFLVLALPYQYGCPSCIQKGLEFFSANKETLKSEPVYLLVSGSNESVIISDLTEKNLQPDNFSVFYDPEERYLPYQEEGIYNPRVSIVVKDKIIFDKIYKASEMQEMQQKIADFVTNK